MALIVCKDCGAEISDAAPVCPKCGRPNDTGTRQSSGSPGKKGHGVTITLSSAVVLLVGLAAAVVYVPAFQVGEDVDARCDVAGGLGNTATGKCTFTNTGWTPGTMCTVVNLVNKSGEVAKSGPICSGRVWPNDTVERPVSIIYDQVCGKNGLVSWQTECRLVVEDYENGHAIPRTAEAPAPEAPAPAAQPAPVQNQVKTSPPLPADPGDTDITQYGPYTLTGVIQDGSGDQPGTTTPAKAGEGYPGLALDHPIAFKTVLAGQDDLSPWPGLTHGKLYHIQMELNEQQQATYKKLYGQHVTVKCDVDFVGRYYTPIYCGVTSIQPAP